MAELLLFPLTIEERFAQEIDRGRGQDGRVAEYVYADWLDEQADPRAEGWRVLLSFGKLPRLRSTRNGCAKWTWYRFPNWYVSQASLLVNTFHQLPGIPKGDRKIRVSTSGSLFESMDAAAIAWVRVERDPLFLRFKR